MKGADVITFLGLVVFATIVGIGALDGRSGLGLFARYSSASLTDVGRRAPVTRRRGDGPSRNHQRLPGEGEGP
jgi:hypothetical protein